MAKLIIATAIAGALIYAIRAGRKWHIRDKRETAFYSDALHKLSGFSGEQVAALYRVYQRHEEYLHARNVKAEGEVVK